MEKDEFNLKILKLITTAEHHFNNLCFNIRALASTWLLATFAGVGWILKDLPTSSPDSSFVIDKVSLLIALCIAGSLGIFVLWILDIHIYQKMTNVWFDNRKKYEIDDSFPRIRIGMKNLFITGRASELIMIYYLALSLAPLLMGIFIAYSAEYIIALWLIAIYLSIVAFLMIYFTPRDKKWMRENRKESVATNKK